MLLVIFFITLIILLVGIWINNEYLREIKDPLKKKYLYIILIVFLLSVPAFLIKAFTVIFLWPDNNLGTRIGIALISLLFLGINGYSYFSWAKHIPQLTSLNEDYILVPTERKLKLGKRRVLGVFQNVLFITAFVGTIFCLLVIYFMNDHSVNVHVMPDYYRTPQIHRNLGYATLLGFPLYGLLIIYISRQINNFIIWLKEGFND